MAGRGEGNARRRDRLAKIKKGPGVFVYDGSAMDTESIPTPLLTGRKTPLFDASGLPALDRAGRQIYSSAGEPVRNPLTGAIVMGGVPKLVHHPVAVYTIREHEFPKGEPIEVHDDELALKLRCLSCFTEVEADETAEAPKRRRKPRIGEAEAGAEG